ncbi:MAG: carbamoyltransferase HypF [Cellulosilyticaceae bacterium]
MDQRTRSNAQTLEITLYGMVQGIGFRPFIVQLAAAYDVTGCVANKGGFVVVTVTGTVQVLEAFIKALKVQAPPQAQIIHMAVSERTVQAFEGFEIVESKEGDSPWVMLPADLPICEECLSELDSQEDRRVAHPLISCMRCGPRYSMIRDIPYDREMTTMDVFEMCGTCQEEYEDRTNRRYYAQTISCHDCGPYLKYQHTIDGQLETSIYQREVALQVAIEDLKKGRCVAIKGIGGYHLACSPFEEQGVSKLRQLKGRETKPFAVMFENLEQIKAYCQVSVAEEELLLSNARPIVLLRRKQSCDFVQGVCGWGREVGAFLPYTAIQHMILRETGPLVMTSANRSGEAIISSENTLADWLLEGLDGLLYHERAIWTKLDDSVARVVAKDKIQIIRRGRGYVPTPLYLGQETLHVMGLGGQLKASFCLGVGQFAYPSEYFGDVEDESVWQWYLERLADLPQLLRFESDVVVCDQHPGYRTTQLAMQFGKRVIAIQHHHAHIGSVMAEHLLERVIGVCFDGTGYGEDGTIWGGEFLVCEKGRMVRGAHLSTVTLIGGDASMKDAAKTASCYLVALGKAHHDPRYSVIRAAISQGINTFTSSSMGRLFDAVANLLGYGDYNHFEGECAMRLEAAAKEALIGGEAATQLSFGILKEAEQWVMDANSLLCQLLEAREQGISCRALALGFHLAVSEAICKVVGQMSEAFQIREIALSGGVFQNTLLLEQTMERLEGKGYTCYINEKVPPNDGGIALGQVYLGRCQMREVT